VSNDLEPFQIPETGWSRIDAISLAQFLGNELSLFFFTAIEVVHRPTSTEERDHIQVFPDCVVFRVRTQFFDEMYPYCMGGIVSVKGQREIRVCAVTFSFSFGRQVSPSGTHKALDLDYSPGTQSAPGHWSIHGWFDGEFEEYDDYDFEYFKSMVRLSETNNVD
jgi:hypothetical protein